MQLKELNLRRNAIRMVGSWAFSGLRRLRALDLSYNHLQVLYPNTFASNGGLKVLLLAGNNLARLPADRPLVTAPRLQVGNRPIGPVRRVEIKPGPRVFEPTFLSSGFDGFIYAAI